MPLITRSLVIMFISMMGAMCAGFPERSWIENERQDIQRGENEAVNLIVNQFDQIDPDDRDFAIETVNLDNTEAGHEGLVTLLSDDATTDEQKDNIVGMLLNRAEEDTPRALMEAASQNLDLLDERLISYFEENAYEPAIPLFKQAIQENHRPIRCIDALRSYKQQEVDLYILGLTEDRERPAIRLKALETVAEIRGDEIRAQALPTYESILRNHADESREVVLIAVRYVQSFPYNEQRYMLLRDLYDNTEDENLRNSLLVAMADLKDTDPESLRDQLDSSLDGADMELAIIRTDEDNSNQVDVRPDTSSDRTVTPRTNTDTNTNTDNRTTTVRPGSYPADYPTRLRRRFVQEFGADNGNSLYAKINNAFKSHADASGEWTNFMVRSYNGYFGTDPAGNKVRLSQGLSVPGSLSIVILNIVDEYESKALRIYVISRMFSITRWQSEIILDIVQRNRI